jgi:hypothetical protein
VNSVTCPDGIKPAQGVSFECTAQLEGVQLPVKVTITQVDVGKGTYDYDMKPTKNVLILEGIVESIKAALRDQEVPTPRSTAARDAIGSSRSMARSSAPSPRAGSAGWCAP